MLTAAPPVTGRSVTARTTSPVPSAAPRPGPRPGSRIVPPTLGIADGPAAAVFRVAAPGGPISRDEATRATGSSIATVTGMCPR